MPTKTDPFIEKLGNLKEIRHIVAEESTPYSKILDILHQERLPSVILTKDGSISGIFTERDVLTKAMLENPAPETPVSELMTRGPITIRTTDTIRDAIELMHEKKIRNLPLLDPDGAIVGLLTVGRVIRYLAYHFPSEVMNLPPKPSQAAEHVEGA
jgi:CBS domain-containing protein